MPDVTPAQRAELVLLTQRLRAIAVRHGPLHSFWDIIGDIECLLGRKPTILQHSAEDWITLAADLLARHNLTTPTRGRDSMRP
jgi:hypothetical protein